MTIYQTIKAMDGEIIAGSGNLLKLQFPIVSSNYEIDLSGDIAKQLEDIQNNRKINLERIRDGLKLLEQKEAAVSREDD